MHGHVDEGKHAKAKQNNVHAVAGQAEVLGDLPYAAHEIGILHSAVEGRKHGTHSLLQHKTDAECGQQGFKRATIEKADDGFFKQHAHAAADHKGSGHSQNEGKAGLPGQKLLHAPGCVGPEHDQLTVGHVDNAHDAKGDGKANGRQYKNGTKAHAEKEHFKKLPPLGRNALGIQGVLCRLGNGAVG